MATPLQEQFNEAVKLAEAIKAGAEAKGSWTPDDSTAFDGAVKKAQDLRKLVEQNQVLEAAKAWSRQSDGASVVKTAFAGEAVFPDEGVIPGVTEATDARGKPTGELIVDESLKGVDPILRREWKMIGAEKLKVLKSGDYQDAFVEYLRAKAAGRAMKATAVKVLQEGADSAGGYWVAPDIRTELVKKMVTIPGVYNDVYRFTVGSDMVTFPKVVYTSDDKYSSGVLPSWNAEAPTANITEATNPIAGRVEIVVYVLSGAVILTRSLMEDAQFDVMGYVTNLLGENYPLFINNAIISGDGVGKPQGILNHENAAVAHASGGMQILSGTAGALTWGIEAGLDPTTQGILGAEASLPPQYETNAKFYANKATYAKVRGLVDGNGRPLWQQSDGVFANFVKGLPPTLVGYPVVKDQFMPAIGAANKPMMFGDLSGYFCPQRVGLSVEVFREVYGLRDMVVLYARMRIGGKLVRDWQMKLLKSNNS